MTYFEKHLFAPTKISETHSDNVGIIVTIPCFNEPDLICVLDSLEECDKTNCNVEVIIHVNSSEDSSEKILAQNNSTIQQFNTWNKNRTLKYFLLHSPALPDKHAGVGLARKIAMDEASHRFVQIKNEKGIIVCLDADCTVDKNYHTEIEKHFRKNPDSVGCSIYFEHPLEGNDYDQNIYNSIINYELFLRYYILSLKWSGFTNAYHTIGSSMAVRADAYMKQGGMNRRKAGEDFYFLHKLFPFGRFTMLNSTRVTPSPRISDRVPFGTGADISKQLLRDDEMYFTYNFNSFIDLRKFISMLPEFYYKKNLVTESVPDSMRSFLQYENFEEKLKEIKSHTSTESSFTKRFFTYFDGFKILKYIHYARDNFYSNEEVTISVTNLLSKMGLKNIPSEKKELLMLLRKIEKDNCDDKL